MDTVLSGAGQPVIVGQDKDRHCNDVILSGHIHDAARHHDHFAMGHGLHQQASQERFGLRNLEEMAQVRREIGELKHDLAVKFLEESCKTRELIRDQEAARLRDNAMTLRAQVIAAGVVPAV